MDRLRSKCLQVGCVIGVSAFLIANIKPLPQPVVEIEPSRIAGASNLPFVDWRETKVIITPPKQEIEIVSQSNIEVAAQPVTETVTQPETEVTVQQELPIETPKEESVEIEEEVIEVETYATDVVIYDKTFFELAVQAEGYTLGYEGMRYIASAIINLARSRGCSVDAVLTSGAYTVVNNGMVWRQNLYDDTIAAVEDELNNQIDTEIKYFRTNYYHGFGTPCFRYGNVYFSK